MNSLISASATLFTTPAAPALFLWAAMGILFSAQARSAVPPDWPDKIHVANGCFLSATVYLAKAAAWNPDVRGRTATVSLPGGRLHTVAVVELNGRVYGRDQYIGVFRVRDDNVQTSFLRALELWSAGGGRHPYTERKPADLQERRAEVALAARLIAGVSPRTVLVQTAEGAVTALAWRTRENRLAVYEPSFGTAVTAEEISPEEVVRLLFGQRVAARAGR